MTQLTLTITAHSPLAIGRQKPGGSVSEVEHYIPGTVVRGAIASYILSLEGTQAIEPGDDFDRLFTGEQPAVFRNAYPAIAQITSEELQAVERPIRVIPATAVSSKTEAGFITASASNSGVFDTLIDRFCAEQVGYPYDPTVGREESSDDPVEPYSGFCSREGDHYYNHTVSTRFLTRVGINRRRAVAEDQLLYSIEVLNEAFLTNTKAEDSVWEPVVFRGEIVVPDETLADPLASFINSRLHQLRLGGSGSRGLGHVTLDAKVGAVELDMEKRIDDFNQMLGKRWDLWASFRSPAHPEWRSRTFFTLDLQADAILTDQWRRTMVISPQMLKCIPGAPQDDSLQLHTAFSSYGYRSGWNAAWGLMKDQELVTQRGGVYLFSTAQPDAWVEVLSQLEQLGIGDRTAEGFGQLRVCHEFHQVMRENPA